MLFLLQCFHIQYRMPFCMFSFIHKSTRYLGFVNKDLQHLSSILHYLLVGSYLQSMFLLTGPALLIINVLGRYVVISS